MTVLEEIAKVKAEIVKAQRDAHTWQVSGEQEKYLEAFCRTEALDLQLRGLSALAGLPAEPKQEADPPATLVSIGHLTSRAMHAEDGLVGHVRAAFFDDQTWMVRYLTIEAGSWLSGREVLIPPSAIQDPVGNAANVLVALTLQQIRACPVIDIHQPVSRQHELEFLHYFLPRYDETRDTRVSSVARTLPEDDESSMAGHLRSTAKVDGYEVRASDGTIGHIVDFIIDCDSWAIRYLVVNTRNWWPLGRRVLIATGWIHHIHWASRTIDVQLTREQVRNSPVFEEALAIDRSYEKHLHASYNREGYWDWSRASIAGDGTASARELPPAKGINE
ncbi:MAG: PRC-barrel domain-containing protein [Betaproteobacteria bacterium]